MSTGGYESVAGYVLLAVVAMFFCYLIPTAIRSRQMAADSRMDDRFSSELRVLAQAGQIPARAESTARGYVHAPRPDQPEASMDRHAEPRSVREPRSAAEARQMASVRAARAAAASRRAAAARRRLALTLTLVAASIVLWTLYVTVSLPIAAPIVLTVLLATAVVLGRRAAAKAALAERRLGAGRSRGRENGVPARHGAEETATPRHARSARPALNVDAAPTTPAASVSAAFAADSATPVARSASAPVRTSVRDTAASLRISVDPAALAGSGEAESARSMPDLPAGEGWTPVPVPVPTYTLKAEAPRRQVPPYEAPEWAARVLQAERDATLGEVAPPEPADADAVERERVLTEVDPVLDADEPAVEQAGTSEAPAHPGDAPEAPAADERQVPAMNLQAVLERRRAVGQ